MVGQPTPGTAGLYPYPVQKGKFRATRTQYGDIGRQHAVDIMITF